MTETFAQAAIALIHENLTDDLRKPEYQGHPNPLYGHCYVAAETLYHLLNDHDVKPCRVEHEGTTHWYLRRRDEIIDPTASQFESPVPYDQGRATSFLTQKRPSQRSRELLRRIRGH